MKKININLFTSSLVATFFFINGCGEQPQTKESRKQGNYSASASLAQADAEKKIKISEEKVLPKIFGCSAEGLKNEERLLDAKNFDDAIFAAHRKINELSTNGIYEKVHAEFKLKLAELIEKSSSEKDFHSKVEKLHEELNVKLAKVEKDSKVEIERNHKKIELLHLEIKNTLKVCTVFPFSKLEEDKIIMMESMHQPEKTIGLQDGKLEQKEVVVSSCEMPQIEKDMILGQKVDPSAIEHLKGVKEGFASDFKDLSGSPECIAASQKLFGLATQK